MLCEEVEPSKFHVTVSPVAIDAVGGAHVFDVVVLISALAAARRSAAPATPTYPTHGPDRQ